MTIDVTLAIEPRDDHRTTASVGDALLKLGGRMFSWQPDLNGTPAKAAFRFETEAARDRFLASALEIPGVSLATVQ